MILLPFQPITPILRISTTNFPTCLMSSNSRITRPFSTDQSDIDETTSELTWVQSKDDPLVVTFNRDPLGKEPFPYQLMVDLAPAIGNVCVFSGDFIPRTRLVPSVIRIPTEQKIRDDQLSDELLKLPKCDSQIDPKDNVQTILLRGAYEPVDTNSRVKVETPFGKPVNFRPGLSKGFATVVTPKYVFSLFGTFDKEIDHVYCHVWRRDLFFHELQNDGLQLSAVSGTQHIRILKYTTRPLSFETVTNKKGELVTVVYPIQTHPVDLLGDENGDVFHTNYSGDVFNEEYSGDNHFDDTMFHTFREEYDGWNKDSLRDWIVRSHWGQKVERLGNNSFRFPKIDEIEKTSLECHNRTYEFTILRFIVSKLGLEGQGYGFSNQQILSFQVPYPSSEVEKELVKLKSPSTLVFDLEVETDIT